MLPAPLARGDLVQVIAPSGVFDPEKLAAGVALLEAAGLSVRYDRGVFTHERYLAGDDARRAGEIANALRSSDVRALWAARGGFGATRLLGAIDPGDVAQARKWLVGFSDATALHGVWARAGLASLHGPNVTTLPTYSEAARQETLGLLMHPSQVTYSGRVLLRGANAAGRLRGGNLTVLAAMAGTSYLPSFADCIVLLEDVGERPYRLDRSLTQLVQAGAFAGARGVVIGQLTNCDEAPGASWTALDVIAEILLPLGLPVLAGLPFGHDSSSRAVLLDATAELVVGSAALVVSP